MGIVKKVSFFILKIAVLALVFYPGFFLATWGAVMLGEIFGYFALLFTLLTAFAYLKFAIWLIGLGSADKPKDKKRLNLREFISNLSPPVPADILRGAIKIMKSSLLILSVLIPAVLFGLALVFPDDAARFFEMRKFDRYCSQADELIAVDYPLNETKYRGFMWLSTPFSNPTFIIDYDEMRVSFDSGSRSVSTYELSREVPAFSDLDVQSEKSLSSPGKVFRTYHDSSDIEYSYVTYGIEIELENGEVWRTKTAEQFFKADNSIPILYEAVRNCDEKIEFSDTQIPMNAANIPHPTLLIDYDSMRCLLVYLNPPIDYREFEFTEFDHINNDLPEMWVVARIEARSPWKEMYVYFREEKYYHMMGFALLSEDGKLYLGENREDNTYGIEKSEYAFRGDSSDILKSLGIS